MPRLPTFAKPPTEFDVLTTPDGTEYVLHGSKYRAVLSDSGTGMPEINYVTQRGPFQHGESVRDFFLRPRVVEMRIRQSSCSRTEYWNLRAALLDILRPNRGLNYVLTKYTADGRKRALNVVIQQGPRFEARSLDAWDEFSINEMLRFVAYNPVYYDPTLHSIAFNTLGGLTFPITFPVTFAGTGATVTINYAGNWDEYPVIVITGPISAISIYNANTNERIGLTYNLAAGRVLTLDLRYGVKSITLDDGTNIIGYLTNTSDFSTFHLQPGTNNISVTGTGTGAGTTVSMNYYERYIGI